MEPEIKHDGLEAVNKLLVDYTKSQSEVIKNLRNMIIVVCVCFTVILCAAVGGYFWYESQFDKTITTTVTQEAETDTGNAIVNNGGQVNYGD